MAELQVADLLTVSGLSVAVTIATSILLGALAWPAPTVDRFGPLLAFVVALVLGIPAALTLGQAVFQAILTALIAGAASQGIHQATKSVTW